MRVLSTNWLLTSICSLTLLGIASRSDAQMSTGGAGGCLGSTGPCQRDAGSAGAGQDQNVSTSGGGIQTQEGPSMSFQDGTAAVTGKPYKGEAITTMTQNLSDGSTIQQTIHAQIARDKAGRTVRVQELGKFGSLTAAPAGTNGTDGPSPTLTTIFDPVAKLHIDFTSDSKVAHEFAVQAPTPGSNMSTQGGFALSTNMPVMMRGRRTVPVMSTPTMPSQSDPTAEQLGSRTIAGVNAIGTRTKTIIPARTIGNSSDITIVHETWFSPDLRMVMESTQTDPRFGQTTYSVTDLDQTDPDGNLFQVPPGYTVQTTPVYTTSANPLPSDFRGDRLHWTRTEPNCVR
jgi:hypothetical protein